MHWPFSSLGSSPFSQRIHTPDTPIDPTPHAAQRLRLDDGTTPSPTAHVKHSTPSTLAFPTPQRLHVVEPSLGSDPGGHSEHSPSTPPLPLSQGTQAVAATLGVCPLGQSVHPPATPAWPEGQGVHVVRFAEYVPSGHTSQPPILAFIRR